MVSLCAAPGIGSPGRARVRQRSARKPLASDLESVMRTDRSHLAHRSIARDDGHDAAIDASRHVHACAAADATAREETRPNLKVRTPVQGHPVQAILRGSLPLARAPERS